MSGENMTGKLIDLGGSTLPNVFVGDNMRGSRHEGRQYECTTEPFREFVFRVASLYPQYTFESDDYDAGNSDRAVRNITGFVVSGESFGTTQCLGNVQTWVHNNAYSIQLNSKRIPLRGSRKTTSNVRVAVKTFAKYFKAADELETLRRTRAEVQGEYRQAQSTALYARTTANRHITGDEYHDAILENLEAYCELVGVSEEHALKAIEANKLGTAYDDFSNTVRHQPALTVLMLDDGRCIALEDSLGSAPITYKSSTELPDQVREAVGFLKLVPNATLIPKQGFRQDNRYYLIAPPTEEET
jgi:hypothetical protein